MEAICWSNLAGQAVSDDLPEEGFQPKCHIGAVYTVCTFPLSMGFLQML